MPLHCQCGEVCLPDEGVHGSDDCGEGGPVVGAGGGVVDVGTEDHGALGREELRTQTDSTEGQGMGEKQTHKQRAEGRHQEVYGRSEG